MLLLPRYSPFVRLQAIVASPFGNVKTHRRKMVEAQPFSLAIHSVGFWTIFARF
jgi:hypothetical protein